MSSFTLQDLEKVIADLRRRLRILEIQGASGIINTGIASARPTTPNVTSGTTISYYAYDTKVLSIWNVDDEDWDEVTLT